MRTRSGNRVLQRQIAPLQPVIFGVGDLGRVILVIGDIVPRNLRGQPLQLGAGLVLGQIVDWRVRDIGQGFTRTWIAS